MKHIFGNNFVGKILKTNSGALCFHIVIMNDFVMLKIMSMLKTLYNRCSSIIKAKSGWMDGSSGGVR